MDIEPASEGTAVQALRAQFDRAFAHAPAPPPDQRHALLAIRAGVAPYAIRLAEIGGLHADRRVLALPGRLPELRGVTAIRGQIVPVYDLAALLGQEAAPEPRWLVLVAARQPLALAFDQFEAHISAAAGQLLDGGADGQAALRHQGLVRPVLDLPSLTTDIRKRIDLLQLPRSMTP